MNATECELQKRVVGLIADERGSLLSPAIVSFLSFLTELEPRTCTVYACMFTNCALQRFIQSRDVLTYIFPARTRCLNITQVLLSNNS